jgi:drug/metabolite transporter (DMT)-like permease
MSDAIADATPAPVAGAPPPSRARVVTVLLAALCSIVVAGPLVVAAEAAKMPAASIAFWRTLIAGSALFAVACVTERPALRALTRRDVLGICATGAILGSHYLLWMGSLAYTSVLSSTVLVTTNPLWVALGAWLLLREPPSRATWIAVAIGIAGAVWLAIADSGSGGDTGRAPLLGDALALAAALASSATLLAGRRLRPRIAFASYASIVSLACAATALAFALVTRAPLLPPTRGAALCVLGIALAPHLVGHTALNWALGHVPAPKVALVILGEPVGATLIAWAFLGQTPHPWAIAGGVLVLIAVAQGTRGSR